jgi:transcriptional regulator with XRE-family HTH domain
VNARVALRLAHGWSQGQAAERWNELWPKEPKTFKNFSYWEQWPSKTGYAPSFDVLNHLAELYNCHVADLLSDCSNFRDRDSAQASRDDLHRLPATLVGQDAATDGEETDSALALARFVKKMDHSSVDELASIASRWAHNLDAGIDRRALLTKLSFALTLAAALPETNHEVVRSSRPAHITGESLSGIWRSEYVYYSSRRKQEYSSVH